MKSENKTNISKNEETMTFPTSMTDMRPDREQLATDLVAIAKKITDADKYAYLAEFRGSLTTVNRYLNGEVKNIPVAVVMLQYFRERAKGRA